MSLLETINSPADLKKLSSEQLPELAREIRAYIIEVISKNGGHLGAALGAVDLTLALHYCFETPKDTIVWDVGHQTHAHKILTGRREAFKTFRLQGGLSGFSNKDESEHDPFTTGHGGASISTSLGIAAGWRILSPKVQEIDPAKRKKVIAVIGDASLVSGMALEALNHAGHLKEDLIVVLNDNEMSISKTVGAISRYLNKIISSPLYNHLRDDVESLLRRIPRLGKQVVAQAKKIDEGLKHLLIPNLLFEEMGFRYFGPIDGHHLDEMIQILQNISKMNGPILLHVITKKGKGYPIAEADQEKWHAATPFFPETGLPKTISKSRTYTAVFGETALKLAEDYRKLVAITAAMCDGTGLVKFSQQFPDRFFDVGIAEEHAVSFAAGLAETGLRPLVAIYSTFLQRAHDQIIHDVALQNLPVAFCLDRAGLVGEDGPTHHGVFDIAFLRKVPNLVVMAPRDGRELENMLAFCLRHPGPIAVRYPRGAVAEETGGPLKDREPERLELGRAELLREGSDVLLLAYGSMVYPAYEASVLLAQEGIHAAVVNARFAKPLDEELILRLAKGKALIVTVEEGALAGGFGSAVLELFERQGSPAPKVRTLGIPDHFIRHGRKEFLLDELGLSPEKIGSETVRLIRSAQTFADPL